MQFLTVPEKDFSRGIDSRSAENQIPEGFVRDLLNADIVEKRARKRVGYQGYAGNLPVRVTSLQYLDSTNQICFTLDSAVTLDESVVDLGSISSSPIVVYGRSSSIASGGPFTTAGDVARYYTGFTVPTRKVMTATAGAPPYESLSISGSEHAVSTTNLFTALVESTSTTNRSYRTALPHDILVDESSYDLDIQYQNSTGADKDVFCYYKNQTPVTGESYVATLAHTGSGSESFTITAGTHGLANTNIIAQIQQDLGSARAQVKPNSLIVAANGDITITLTAVSAATFYAILSAAPIENQETGNVAGNTTTTVTVAGTTSPWIFYGIYLEVTPGGDRELVYPDSVEFDDSDGSFTVTFTNGTSAARNCILYYSYGFTRSNQLCVTDATVTTNGTDSRPQLTIWGLDHTDIYGQSTNSSTNGNRNGWANHIDSYRSSGEQRVVAGLGGNLFTAQTFEEVGSTYLFAQLYPNLQARTASVKVLGPLFWDTGDTPGRTRGYITGDTSGTNWVVVTAVEYDTLNDWTKYTLSVPNKQILDSAGSSTPLSNVISVTSDLEDYLTVQDMSYARHNGTFKIRQVQDGAEEIHVWVENADNSIDYDDANTGGEAAVFTDQITWLTAAPFDAGDTIENPAGDTLVLTAVSSVGTVTVASGFIERVDLAGGLTTTGTRTSSVIPMREGQPLASASVENLVKGDMLAYSGIERLLRIVDIDTDENTVTVDEELTWSDSSNDSTFFTVPARWIPVEAPDDSYNQTPSTYVRHFDLESYGQQPFLRSTMVQNNMYLTNGSDEVLKYDGENIYRAGLFPWQPGLFITQDTAASAKIVADNPTSTPTAVSVNIFTVPLGDENKFPVGQRVRHSFTGGFNDYTVLQTYNDNSSGFVKVQRTSTVAIALGASPGLTLLSVRRYYFRLNAIDVNDNIVASAITGYQDHVVELAADAAVNIKGVGLPAWGIYDYDRLEVEIYGTKLNTAAPFYKITTQRLDFDQTEGYFNYTDSYADTDLIDLDSVSTALKGAELGTTWQEPLRSKYVTSLGNSLVLGHLRDYPQLDIQLVASGAVTNSTYAGKIFTFRRDNTDTGTTTDMVNVARYEFVPTSSSVAVTAAAGTAGVSFVITANNTASAGDWVYLFWSTVATSGRPLTYSGWWQIASATATTVTVNFAGSGAGAITTSVPDKALFATDPTDIPVPLGTDGNMGMVNGDSFDLFDTMRRMSLSINSSMRMTDVSIPGYGSFQPWLVARGGNDVGKAGRLIVRQPKAESLTPEVELPSSFSGGGQSFEVFVNEIRRLPGNGVSCSTRVYPSRIIASYENYPEIFDNPTSVIDTESDSAIDVNSADGQEITGILPFFGEAAFGAAQQSTVLVVFKTNSIYLVDINEKRAGRNPVQRIETEGLGCTAPYSIASTKRGIIFANDSGIYCLRRSQAIDYVGRFMERNYLDRVNLDQLALAQGHHYGNGRCYKLSLPLSTDTINSEVYVYNHTGEEEGRLGAWSRYDNHPATGWSNLGVDAYFGSTTGRVFSLRRVGDETDYRDDSSAIALRVETRANDFGNSGIRKVLDAVLVNYRTLSGGVAEADVSFSADLSQEFRISTEATVRKPQSVTGIDDFPARDIVQIEHDTDRRRGCYFAVRVENSQIDEDLEVAGLDYRVGGLTEKGTVQARQTETARNGR